MTPVEQLKWVMRSGVEAPAHRQPRYGGDRMTRSSLRTCAQCGENLTRSQKRYCSTACYDLNREHMPPIERALSKVTFPENESACWLWTGSLNTYGYGHIEVKGRNQMAHRLIYEHYVAPIPEGMQIDHLCRVRNCVNPTHLEVVTRKENLRRGFGAPAVNARRTHCKRGHEFTPENTLYYAGYRNCKVCKRASQARSNAALTERRRRRT